MKKPRLPETKVRIPMPEVKPPKVDLAAEFDRLYLEKCKEVNELEQKVEKYKSMAEIAVKQKQELENRLEDQKELTDQRHEQLIEAREQLEAAQKTIRELAAEVLTGFIPDVEPPEELPEALMEELPLWRLQPTTAQDILCLSSALKNLHDIHKCDSFILYSKMARGLEKKIDHYFGED